MGDLAHRRRQSQVGSGLLVAFDFDGTLTSRDSFPAFLRLASGRRYATGSTPAPAAAA